MRKHYTYQGKGKRSENHPTLTLSACLDMLISTVERSDGTTIFFFFFFLFAIYPPPPPSFSLLALLPSHTWQQAPTQRRIAGVVAISSRQTSG